MNTFTDFIKIIEEFIELFDGLISVEQSKLEATVKNRVTFVEECMNKEQAAILRLRGLEQKREAEQERLGMKDYTFRQILEHAPEDSVTELTPLFNRLSEQVRTFQSISESAKNAIEVNLHVIQSAISSDMAGKNTYSPTGDKKDDDNKKHFTSRSV